MDGNTTRCEIRGDWPDDKKSLNDTLHINIVAGESKEVFLERLLAANEFSIKVRIKCRTLDERIAINLFSAVLESMTQVIYNCGYHEECRYQLLEEKRHVTIRDATQEYWDEQHMKRLLAVISRKARDLIEFCDESNVKKIHLGGGEIDVSELMESLKEMQLNFFDKL